MYNKINVNGIRLYAYHGCLEEEGRVGAEYIVDVTLLTDFMPAAMSDELGQTIDYCGVFEIAKAEMAIRSKLIEHVCSRIYHRIRKEFPAVTAAHVKVTKLLPPMNGPVDQVSVEIGDFSA